jgi:hypothetical protein
MKNQVTYTTYTNGQIKEIKQGIRAKIQKKKLAQDLCKKWGSGNISGVYQKILKINRQMTPVRKRMTKKDVSLNFEITKAEPSTGITLTGDALKVYNKLKREHKKIVLFEDHVRYYF